MLYRKLAICLLLVAGLSTWSHAQSQQTICAGGNIPTGWIVIHFVTNFGACGGTTNDEWTLEQISGMGAGATVNGCSGFTPPDGWVQENVSTNFSDCGGTTNDITQWLNLNGLAIGTQKSVCAGDPLPSGWQVQSTSTDFTRCTGTTNDIETIKRIS